MTARFTLRDVEQRYRRSYLICSTFDTDAADADADADGDGDSDSRRKHE